MLRAIFCVLVFCASAASALPRRLQETDYYYGSEDVLSPPTPPLPPAAPQFDFFEAINASCDELFPDLTNNTVREQGGFNKLFLVLLEGSFVSFLGADRFYMGMPVAGTFKLLTFSGVGVWFLFDYINVMANAIFTSEGVPWSMQPLAFTYDNNVPQWNYYWTDCSLTLAQIAAIFLFIVNACCVCIVGFTCLKMVYDKMKGMFSGMKVPSMG